MRKRTKTSATISMTAMLMMGMTVTGFAAPGTAATAPGTTTSTTTSTTTVKNGWVTEQNGKDTVWYYYGNNVRYRNQWVKSNNLWYYMGSDGTMLTGWQTIDGFDYYFESSGAMATGWRKLTTSDRSDSYSSGPMGSSSSSSSGSNWYYFATAATGKGYAEGTMVQGWLQVGDNWYYLADNDIDSSDCDFEYGQMVYGEVEIDGREYYFGKENEGVMKTGFVKASELGITTTVSRPGGSTSTNEGTYYYETSGSNLGAKKVNSWLHLDNNWYYFDEEGKMVTGQMATDSKGRWVDYDSGDASYYYYLDPSTGKMQTGWVTIKDSETVTNSPLGSSSSGKYYQYYDNSGVMRLGWLNLSGKWYYLTKENDAGEITFDGFTVGQMATGYKEIEDDGFYFSNSGVMETSVWKEVDDSSRWFGSNGAMLKSKNNDNLEIVKKSGRIYPVDEDGKLFPAGDTIYYNGSRYSSVNDFSSSKSRKVYEVSSSGYLVEVKD